MVAVLFIVFLLAIAVLQILHTLIPFGLLYAGTLQISADLFKLCQLRFLL